MSNKLREIFCPTPEEEEKQIKRFMELHEEYMNRPKPHLIPDGTGLMKAEPFGPFYGDCESCKYYYDPMVGYITGGDCTLKGIACGYGFTCDSHTFSEIKIEIKTATKNDRGAKNEKETSETYYSGRF